MAPRKNFEEKHHKRHAQIPKTIYLRGEGETEALATRRNNKLKKLAKSARISESAVIRKLIDNTL